MNVLLNELSYLHADKNIEEAQIKEIFVSMATAVKFFNSLESTSQVTYWTSDPAIHQQNHVFLRGNNFRAFLGLLNAEQRTVILSMFDRLNDLDTNEAATVMEPTLKVETASVTAFLKNTPANYGAISLFSHKIWCSNSIKFTGNGIDILINNWPQIKFENNLTQYLSSVTSFYMPHLPRVEPQDHVMLPYRQISEVIFKDEGFKEFYNELPKNGKLAAYQTVGTAIANINGYVESQLLNKLNSTAQKKRNIFYNKNIKKHISIDYETGTFEFLNEKGFHLGEYNFDGKKLKNADTKGKHNIKIK